jgi:hypothetical protein
MSYVVIVTDAVQAKVSLWGLPPEVEEEVYERLDKELGQHKDEVLRVIVAPVRLLQYSFSMKHEDEPFTFAFRVEEIDSETIAVVDACKIGRAVTRADKIPLVTKPLVTKKDLK